MIRYKIVIEYDGTGYSGMQSQTNNKTIQKQLEIALSSFFDKNITITFSGRTDAGVHALGQVAHFDTAKDRRSEQVVCGVNYFLKKQQDTIAIISAEKVNNDFHSRFDAKKRYYIYKIMNRSAALTLQKNTHCLVHKKLNIHKIIEATQYLIGEHDFTSFRASRCQAKSPIIKIDNIEVINNKISDDATEIKIIINARSFLYHMVRNIIGSLLEIGKGNKKPIWIKEILGQKDRSKAAKTSEPQGLYLWKIEF